MKSFNEYYEEYVMEGTKKSRTPSGKKLKWADVAKKVKPEFKFRNNTKFFNKKTDRKIKKVSDDLLKLFYIDIENADFTNVEFKQFAECNFSINANLKKDSDFYFIFEGTAEYEIEYQDYDDSYSFELTVKSVKITKIDDAVSKKVAGLLVKNGKFVDSKFQKCLQDLIEGYLSDEIESEIK